MRLPAAMLISFLAPTGAVAAECAPSCDYNHYYGPYIFGYEQPGLYAYPICDRRGNCSPNLAYFSSPYWSFTYQVVPAPRGRGRIEVRFPRRRPAG